jgi:pimeloyl-ACP methyl ester carboxylesterase
MHKLSNVLPQHMMMRPLVSFILALLVAGAMIAPARAAAIDRSLFISLGGLEQWISIKGEDARRPVLLIVHGGPGEAQWPYEAQYKAWEKAFTVVQWDQRGAGHTYGRYGAKTPQVNLDRISKDGVELAQYLCRTLGKKKIVVLGHSWGTIVAVRMVQTRPDLFATYVGTGQVASWKATVNAQFVLLLAKARAAGDVALVKQLEAIGRPDPANAAQYFGFTKNFRAAWTPEDRAWIASLRAKLPALTASDPTGMKNFADGMDFSAEHVLPDQMATDLPATASRIDTAFFVIQGKDDVITPTAAAVDYFNRVTAPVKKLILLPNAGHFAFMTSPDFLPALVNEVRPVAIARGA